MSRKKKSQTMTGVLRRFLVYKGPIIVGKGYVVLWQDKMSIPVLEDNSGEALSQDWYTLVPDMDVLQDTLVVIGRGIH